MKPFIQIMFHGTIFVIRDANSAALRKAFSATKNKSREHVKLPTDLSIVCPQKDTD